jgi:hypothetical protein
MSKDENKSNWDGLPDHLKDDLFIQVFMEMDLAKGHSRMLVLVTHGFIELLVNTLIKHHAKNHKKILKDTRSYPHSTKLIILNELGILDDGNYKLFDWFRGLRNEAAHKPIFSVTEEHLEKVANEEFKDPNNFHRFCIFLLGGFWNRHVKIFGPVFAPGAVGINKPNKAGAAYPLPPTAPEDC